MVKTETKLSNESGYVFLVLDCEDAVKAGFDHIELACESIRMSFLDTDSVRLDDRDNGIRRYSVILLASPNGGEEEYRGCILKQPMSRIPVGIVGL